MALTWQTPGVTSTDALSPMLITTPGGVAAGDLLIAIIGMKPSVASSGNVATPAGWTALGSHVGGGYGATLGADTGNTHLFVFYQVVVTPTASVDFTLTNANATWGQMFRITATSQDYDLAMAVGEDTAAGNVSIAFTSNPGTTTDDIVIGALCIPTDVTTPAQFSVPAFSQTGATFAAATEIQEYDTATGNDLGGVSIRSTVTAGTGSANPSMTLTAGGTTTNVRGPGVFIRVREVAASTSPIAGSAAGTSTASATLTGIAALVGSAAGVASASATLVAKGKLAGSVVCSSTASGTLRGRGSLAGSSQGVASVSGTLREASTNSPIAGSAAGTSTATATLRAKGKLAGASAGTAVVIATIKAKGKLSGSSQGSSVGIGILKGKGMLMGIASGVGFASGRLNQPGATGSSRARRSSLTIKI
jgi:hypothetical protein